MGKLSGYSPDTSPTTDDKVPTIDGTSGLNKIVLLSDLLILFFNQTSIPAGSASPVTRGKETFDNFVASGGVWSADSVGVNRNASMTAMIVYINGRRISISAVTARTFTASKDTYIDVLDNQDGTGTLVYTEVTNGAASPALAANSTRVGKIVTGATTIAATSSITQTGKDSLGNWIYLQQPAKQPLVKWRQGGTAGDGTWQNPGTTNVDVSGKSIFIQAGVAGIAGAETTVTFPVPFTQIPIVVGTPQTAAGFNTSFRVRSVTTTGFIGSLIENTTASTQAPAENFGWMAIGQ